MRQSTNGFVYDNSPMVEDFLELCRGLASRGAYQDFLPLSNGADTDIPIPPAG